MSKLLIDRTDQLDWNDVELIGEEGGLAGDRINGLQEVSDAREVRWLDRTSHGRLREHVAIEDIGEPTEQAAGGVSLTQRRGQASGPALVFEAGGSDDLPVNKILGENRTADQPLGAAAIQTAFDKIALQRGEVGKQLLVDAGLTTNPFGPKPELPCLHRQSARQLIKVDQVLLDRLERSEKVCCRVPISLWTAEPVEQFNAFG